MLPVKTEKNIIHIGFIQIPRGQLLEALDQEKNTLLNLLNHQPDIGKCYLYAKDPYETKCQLLISKHKWVGSKHCNEPKAFIEYLNDMDDIYQNIDECNSNKKCKILIVFDDMTADMPSNKKQKYLLEVEN